MDIVHHGHLGIGTFQQGKQIISIIGIGQKETDIDSHNYSEEEISAYADAILDVLADQIRYDQMCRNCREKIETRFSTDRMIEQLEEIFRETQEAVRSTPQEARFPNNMKGWANQYLETYLAYENAVDPQGNGQDLNMELKRIANSRLGSLVIKLLMKLKINKLFR